MQQVGKRTIAHGNSGSYYSGADHSDQIKFNVSLVHRQKGRNFSFKLKSRDVGIRSNIAFVNIKYLKLTIFRCAKRLTFDWHVEQW